MLVLGCSVVLVPVSIVVSTIWVDDDATSVVTCVVLTVVMIVVSVVIDVE